MVRAIRRLSGLVSLALGVACGTGEVPPGGHPDAGTDSSAPPALCPKGRAGIRGPVPTFSATTLSRQPGAAYLLPADLDGDAYPEFLLTSLAEGFDFSQGGGGIPLANGGAYVLAREGGAAQGTLGTWSATKVFDSAAGIGFPNQSQLFDVDGDGADDWVVGAGFLTKPTGRLVWMKGDGRGQFGAPAQIAVPDPACWYHVALPLDMDGDGDQDFVTSCHVGTAREPGGPSRVEWFENRSAGSFAHHAIADGGGSLLALHDLDGDGDQDVIAPQFFGPEALVWFEQTGAKGSAFAKHVINDSTGRGFLATIADMNGDGRADLVYGNHNNQTATEPRNQVMGLYWFDVPPAGELPTLRNWDAHLHVIHEGFMVPEASGPGAGAPGMLAVGDIDGDCDLDVTASGDGDEGLYLFVQQDDGFELVVLSRGPQNQNAGEQHLVDLDRDGDLDVVWAVFGPQGPQFDSRVDAFLQQ